MRRHYHATEAILDLIAASGPQEAIDINAECSNQCTSPEFDARLTIGEHHDASEKALVALIAAGLVERDGTLGYITYDLTDYGYVIMGTPATPAFKANAANHIW